VENRAVLKLVEAKYKNKNTKNAKRKENTMNEPKEKRNIRETKCRKNES
jgi:hypothetical protein